MPCRWKDPLRASIRLRIRKGGQSRDQSESALYEGRQGKTPGGLSTFLGFRSHRIRAENRISRAANGSNCVSRIPRGATGNVCSLFAAQDTGPHASRSVSSCSEWQ